ncbi:MAG: Tex family protein [Planctomycetota bacterium]
MTDRIVARIGQELSAADRQVEAAVALLDGGATVPFIARYRKEATGGLDDVQLRALEERLTYLRELEERRAAVLESIQSQGKLTPELQKQIEGADTKQRLEDLYLPYKQKRRTKAMIAREAGIEPLADALLQDPAQEPLAAAAKYLNAEAGFADAPAVLEGAQQILMERFAEDATLLQDLREYVWTHAELRADVASEQKKEDPEAQKFRDYFAHKESLASMPSHRALAILRARREGAVLVDLWPDPDGKDAKDCAACEQKIAARFQIADKGRKADAFLRDTVRKAWRIKVSTHLDVELMTRLRERAEEDAMAVFGANLKDLLLAAPAGARCTMGLDPGLRTGVKVAVVDKTGKVVDTATIYPHVPFQKWDESIGVLAALCKKHAVEVIAFGNGTASRETDKLVRDLLERHPDLGASKVMVSEAGASVYSASELASQELPRLDVSLRGAVSIARRLQDPLAELVKIEPKAIGVGQYQHDLNQSRLGKRLDAVVEDCVNGVGVDLNTASPALLSRVAGLSPTLAKNIVSHRDQHGAFRSRKQLLDVDRLGPKAFEQSAGFLRIRGGDNPLDASGVHPEAYPVVERILAKTGRSVDALVGDTAALRGLRPDEFTDATFGVPTVADILQELEKPGRDPRPEFKTATFQDGVEAIADLKEGMILEGVVTNVAQFGAFVDIGVHQDGLVHVSCLSRDYVSDPRTVVKAGQVVRVKVLSVDVQRQRIGLSMRLDDAPGQQGRGGRPRSEAAESGGRGPRPAPPPPRRDDPPAKSALAAALDKWQKKP